MNGYTNIFGGDNINPAYLSYKFYPIGEDVHLVWPFEALDGANVVAQKMDVQAQSAGLAMWMPDATLVSVGEDVLWNNVGAFAFTVFDYSGNTIVTVAPGTQWFTYLTANSTSGGDPLVNGVWQTTQFGAGTSTANAAALAGLGLRANLTKLDQNLITNNPNTDLTLVLADRAHVIRNTGGSVIHTLTSASTLGNGWFAVEINAGTGSVTITPTVPDLIDGAATKVLSAGESLTVYSYGTGFATMGYGRSFSTSVSGISIDLAGGGDYPLSATELKAQVQDFNGALTANRQVIYGAVTGYWFIYNHTTNTPGNTFGVSFKGGPADDPVTVPQGSFSILRANNGALDIAFTATSGTVTSIATIPGETTGGYPIPITSTGTIGLASMPLIPAAGVGGYPGTSPADPSKIPLFAFDIKGRMTEVLNYDLNIKASVPVTSEELAAVLTDETGFVPAVVGPPIVPSKGVAVFSEGPTVKDINLTGAPVAPTPAPGTANSVTNKAYVDAAIAAAIAAIPSGFKPGDIKYTLNGTLEAGFLYLNGSTLGDATSGATNAGPTFQALYEFFWKNFSDALCPVSSGRSTNPTTGATDDFNAHKTLKMLDARGRILAGADNMGGTFAGRLGSPSDAGGIVVPATLGVSGGQQGCILDITQMPVHHHQIFNELQTGGTILTGTGGLSDIVGRNLADTADAGNSYGHNNVQPTLVCNVLVKI